LSKRVRESAPRRYSATVEYDGTDFAGFQRNPGKRTVQGVLEDAFERVDEGFLGLLARSDGSAGLVVRG